MAGLLRFYNGFFANALGGTYSIGTDTIRMVLLNSTHIPNSGVGTRSGNFSYLAGDVVYNSLYNCYFVAANDGITALGTPVLDGTVGASTLDGTVVWVSCGLAPPSNHAVLADISGSEVSGTGYVSGGEVTTLALTQVGGRAVVTSPGVEWTSSSIVAKYAALYKDGTFGALTNPLLAYMLLNADGSNMESKAGGFRVKFSADTFLRFGAW